MTLINRIKRAVFLDEKVYSEIAEDKNALLQAIIVVLLAKVIGGTWFIISSFGLYLILILILALPLWFIATMIMHITAKLLGGKADFVSYLKAIGFAKAPVALGVIPVIGWIIGPIWVFASYFIATKVVHRLSTGKAVIVAVIVPIILMNLIIKMNVMIYFSLERGNIGDLGLAFAIIELTLLLLFSLL